MIFDVLFITSTTILLMLIWFNSDAFIEYVKVIGGGRFFGVTEFEEIQKERASLDYHGYLLEYKDSFFIRLITCPLCSSVWLSAIVTLLYSETFIIFPICSVSSLILYKLTSKLLNS